MTDKKFLKLLDDQLQSELSSLENAPLLKKIRGMYSFEYGFTKRSFVSFNLKEFSVIGRGWGL